MCRILRQSRSRKRNTELITSQSFVHFWVWVDWRIINLFGCVCMCMNGTWHCDTSNYLFFHLDCELFMPTIFHSRQIFMSLCVCVSVSMERCSKIRVTFVPNQFLCKRSIFLDYYYWVNNKLENMNSKSQRNTLDSHTTRDWRDFWSGEVNCICM